MVEQLAARDKTESCATMTGTWALGRTMRFIGAIFLEVAFTDASEEAYVGCRSETHPRQAGRR